MCYELHYSVIVSEWNKYSMVWRFVLGGYDHLLKVVLVAHGLPAPILATLIPPALGPTGDLAYEALGITLLPLGIYGLATLKFLSTKKDEE